MDLSHIAHTIPAEPLAPGLYVTATPIGNAADLTLRALKTLISCDIILCEDTRVTSKLLSLYGLSKPMRPYHDRNGKSARPGILRDLEAGKALALVSDAGLPLISDPGFPLVRAAQDAGFKVEVLPGANAALTALCLSGLPPDKFWFGGFLPTKSAARIKALEPLKALDASLVFYESPRRLAAVLQDVIAALGDRSVAVCRELTKRYEEVTTGSASALAEQYASSPAPKGEVVLVVSGPQSAATLDDAQVIEHLETLMVDMTLKEAVAAVTTIGGRPKREIYELALGLKQARAAKAP